MLCKLGTLRMLGVHPFIKISYNTHILYQQKWVKISGSFNPFNQEITPLIGVGM